VIKRLLQLPQAASLEFLYAPVSPGGLGLIPATEIYAALKITHGLQTLHSSGPHIRAIARGQLTTVVCKRYALNEPHWANRDDELVQAYLNDELGGRTTRSRRKCLVTRALCGSTWPRTCGSRPI
jgi:hypothetical protein